MKSLLKAMLVHYSFSSLWIVCLYMILKREVSIQIDDTACQIVPIYEYIG